MQRITAMLRHRTALTLAVTAAGVFGATGVASAATYTVTTTTDSNDGACTTSLCSLRDAVVAADSSGSDSTINVPAGTYKLTIPSAADNDPTTGDLDIGPTGGVDSSGLTVTLTGAGAGSTIIDAGGVDRAFSVDNGSGLTISGVTIENGVPDSGHSNVDGGGIYSDGALNVSDVAFYDNFANGNDGGAIYADSEDGSTLSVAGSSFDRNSASAGSAISEDTPADSTVTQSVFTRNVASDDGTIYTSGSNAMTVDHSIFTGNDTTYGGGIYWDSSGAATVTNSSFTGNRAAWEDGGAVYDTNSSGMTFTADRFTDNAAGYGGSLYLDSGDSSYTVDGSEFDSNAATYDGGAIDVVNNGSLSSSGSSFVNNIGEEGGAIATTGPLTLVNGTLSGNTATYGGGISFTVQEDPPVTLTNDTIAFNSAGSGLGGGVYGTSQAGTDETHAGIENTIIAGNSGGDCGDSGSTSQFAAPVDQGNNLDSDSSCFGGLGASGDKTGVDPKLGQAADNGGPVLTDAELGGSPAIDAGSNTNCPATDARGISRPQGAACDMGAYEAAPAKLTLTKSAPANGSAGVPITYTLTVTGGGPGPSTGTTVVDHLPAGESLFGSNASQGSCTSSGSPATVTCALGNLASGASATVTIVAAEANAGQVTNTSTASNDQGSNVSASATTMFASTAANSGAKTPPSVVTGPSNHIGQTRAWITGTLGTAGSSTTYFFQVGTSKAYGRVTSTHTMSTSGNVVAKLTGLKLGTVYHYRLVGVNGAGTRYGKDRTFRTKGRRLLGKLVLDGRSLTVRGGHVFARFTCVSSIPCVFRFSIVIHARIANTDKFATLVFTTTRTRIRHIGAHRTVTEAADVNPASLAVLEHARGGHILGRITARPRSNQRGIIEIVTLILR